MSYFFSPSTLSFYPAELKSVYESAGTWPKDVSEVSDVIFSKYSGEPPEGYVRGVIDGAPAWVSNPHLTDNNIEMMARNYRDAFLLATDIMLTPDFSISDVALTDENRAALINVRSEFKKWPTLRGWPQVELPEIPQWILDEAIKKGYVVPVWPLLTDVE